YDPVADTWLPLSTIDAPDTRASHTAVWTGSVMIVWGGGGYENTGGRYDPIADTWLPTSTFGAPEGRTSHSAVWTGSMMVVWAGYNGTAPINTGGRYDPVSDT